MVGMATLAYVPFDPEKEFFRLANLGYPTS